VTVTYGNGVTAQATVNTNGNFYSPQPKTVPNGTTFTVSGIMGNGTPGTAPGTLARLFDPPNNQVLTAFTALPGSTATLAGNTVPLTGGFTSLETNFDYNELSPTYADMTGHVLGSNFQLGNAGLGLSIQTSADIPFTLNLATVLSAAKLDNFQSANAAVPPTAVNLLVTLNGQPHSASGLAMGIGTFVVGDDNSYVFDASLSSDLGPITMHLVTDAPSSLVPEPASWTLLLIGVGAIALNRRSRYRG
jgi:hypothetical protein